MNKLTIKKGNDKYNILLDQYKIILGNNENIKFNIVRTLNRFQNNFKPTEYATEYNNIPQIYLNDKLLKSKDVWIYYVTKYYSLAEDFKLTTKSLIAKYLEIMLADEQFMDTINTINILFESLSTELSLESIITGQFTTMVPKQLMKIISPLFISDEFSKDEYDMNIEEIILLQLKLIKFITDKNLKTNVIVIEIQTVTKEIYCMIKSMKNCIVLIITNVPILECKDIYKYMICNNKILDIADDQNLYDLICDNDIKLLTLEEGRNYMEKYLFEKEHEKARFIKNLLG